MSDTIEAPDVVVAEVHPRDEIRADLEKNFAEITGRETARETETPEAPEVPDGRPRDEHGRFAPKTQDSAPVEKPPEVKAPETSPEPTEAKTPETAAAVEPPQGWPAAAREKFKALPPDLQAVVVERDKEQTADYTRKLMGIAAFRRDYEPVAQMFEPHKETMRQKGFTPASLVQGWYATEKALMDGQGPQVIANIVKGYNISPADVARALGISASTPVAMGEEAPPPPEGQAGAIHPEILERLNGVITWINQSETRQQQQAAEQHQQHAARVMSEIERFAQEKGPDGMPLRPHFAEVEDDMALLAETIRKKGGDIPPLDDLYDRAVWANPMTRSRLQAHTAAVEQTQRASQERQRAEEARAKAARSQRASASVTGAPGTGHVDPRTTGELSRKEQLEQAWAEAQRA